MPRLFFRVGSRLSDFRDRRAFGVFVEDVRRRSTFAVDANRRRRVDRSDAPIRRQVVERSDDESAVAPLVSDPILQFARLRFVSFRAVRSVHCSRLPFHVKSNQVQEKRRPNRRSFPSLLYAKTSATPNVRRSQKQTRPKTFGGAKNKRDAKHSAAPKTNAAQTLRAKNKRGANARRRKKQARRNCSAEEKTNAAQTLDGEKNKRDANARRRKKTSAAQLFGGAKNKRGAKRSAEEKQARRNRSTPIAIARNAPTRPMSENAVGTERSTVNRNPQRRGKKKNGVDRAPTNAVDSVALRRFNR